MLKAIMEKLHTMKIPAVDVFPSPANERMLISLYQDPEQLGQTAAGILEKIIGGEDVETIAPVIQTTTKLVVNMSEAKELGFAPPPQLIGDATEVIE